MSETAHMDMLYHKEFESMDDYPNTFDWWMVEKRAEAEATIASLQAEVERFGKGLEEIAQFDYRLGIDRVRAFAYGIRFGDEPISALLSKEGEG